MPWLARGKHDLTVVTSYCHPFYIHTRIINGGTFRYMPADVKNVTSDILWSWKLARRMSSERPRKEPSTGPLALSQ